MCGEYVRAVRIVCPSHRFIPTCVGNTLNAKQSELAEIGSSPRVWGIRGRWRVRRVCIRFIPTCVGNTCLRGDFWNVVSVHPHVCGEYVEAGLGALAGCGSSPRVWGIRMIKTNAVIKIRFIPTCVGNTMTSFRAARSSSGSSPRVWGIRLFQPIAGS